MKSADTGSTILELLQAEMTDAQFLLFRDLIASKTGIWLRETKCPMLTARLQRRLRALKLPSFEAYYRLLLSQDPAGEECRELINCVTTNKTSFFREQHHFDFLGRLFHDSTAAGVTTPFGVWSSACSTGEEPYSMAMTLRSVLDRSPHGRPVTIVASDIDTQVLRHAQSAIYREADLDPVPVPFRQRFFLRGSGSQVGLYRLKPEIRNQIDFHQMNFVDPVWPISGAFDIIFCRNVRIYFEQPMQDRILRRLAGYLKPGGHLVVGHAEHLHWMTDILQPVGTTIYRLFKGSHA
jgi:chemotaxis protein methyltransferase CheR